jgi:hypothetical protein
MAMNKCIQGPIAGINILFNYRTSRRIRGFQGCTPWQLVSLPLIAEARQRLTYQL